MKVLGIETSCDETAAAVVGESGILSDIIYSQAIHADYGGVVPELAARAHLEKIHHTVKTALERAQIERPDAVAATAGPGLIGALLVGLSFGKALAAGWKVPFIAVNHLEAHLLSPLLETPAPTWPFLALVVSGGHTALYRCERYGQYTTLGETTDDAAGEAYDKVAKMLNLGYPGGPLVDRLAQKGDPEKIAFPRPQPGEFDFSFSGLKAAVRREVLSTKAASPEDICASFQRAVIDCLTNRLLKASRYTGISQVAIAGGVAANSALRAKLQELPLQSFLPPKSRCTDNGSMIAHAGRLKYLAGQQDPFAFPASPSWPIG